MVLEPTSWTYSPRQEAILNRLVPAWITEDFSPVADLLLELGTPQPESAWSPGSLPNERLQRMNEIWQGQAGGAGLPGTALCDPAAFGELAAVMMFLDFREDGRSLTYRHYGHEVAAHANANWQGRTTAEMAHLSGYSLLFASSYLASATLREPLYTELVSAPNLVSTTWCRYLLPYADELGTITSFACGNLPVPGLRSWPLVEGRPQATKNRRLALSPVEREATSGVFSMERNARDILAFAPTAVMVVAPETGLIQFSNDPMSALLGHSAAVLQAIDPRRLFADPADYDRGFAQALSGAAPRDCEVRLVCADGSERWALMSAHSTHFDYSPRITFWLYDISGRKAAEEALQAARSQQAETIRQLQEALAHVNTLEGIIPICSYCKKIRNDEQYWLQVEQYISERTQARFSHGICPDCSERYFKVELEAVRKSRMEP